MQCIFRLHTFRSFQHVAVSRHRLYPVVGEAGELFPQHQYVAFDTVLVGMRIRSGILFPQVGDNLLARHDLIAELEQ